MSKLVQRTALLLGVLLVVALGVWFLARPTYRGFKERRAVASAQAFLAKGDARNAALSARQALSLNTNNVEACKIMARVAELSRAPQVLDWRRRIAELSPTVENRLLLASSALRVQGPPFALAVQTLDELEPHATNLAAYHVIRAEVALKLRDGAQAEKRYALALQLEPTNELHQLNLSVLRLQSSNTTESAQARATLEQLRTNANYSTVALSWLVADRVARTDWTRAEAYSMQLLADRRSGLEDRLEHLNILRAAKRANSGDSLRNLQAGASTNASEVYAVSAWMISHGMAAEALTWISSLPAKTKAEQPVPLAMVDGFLAVKDWAGLSTFLQPEQWGELEFLRLAFLSRAAAEMKESLVADKNWRAAVRQAGDRLGPLNSLLSMASAWGKTEAREDLLLQIAQRFPREQWAFRELERSYNASGNTAGLNKIYASAMNADPSNFAARNNFATTSMLLGKNLPKAHELARDLYAQHPQDPVIASTYAFSLHLQGRTNDSLTAIRRLPVKDLDTPSIALYYAAILARVGETNQARQSVALAEKGQFLPEERRMLQELRRSL